MATMKSPAEADWIDAGVVAVPCTKSGLQIVWQCYIGLHHGTVQWADFQPHEALRMESALADNELAVNLNLYDDAWSIDLSLMQQKNIKSGTIRPIRRCVILKQGVLED